MPNLLNENVTAQISEVFASLQNNVHLIFFFRRQNCDYCDDAKQLMEEVAALSDKLSLTVHDLDADFEIAQRYQMDKAPGIVIAARDDETVSDLGIRYAGIPSGHEFSSFIQDIILASARDSGLSAGTREFLQALTKPVHLQVFVTPT
jgi:glutaredoxin-like protein